MGTTSVSDIMELSTESTKKIAIANRHKFLSQTSPSPAKTGVLREAKPGGFQTRVFPTFFGKGPDCVADPFGTVPRRCS